jgi:predicted transposase/invertase (TIGR01784 family)
MKPLLSLKNDFVFRILFTRDVEILKDLLNNVLGLRGGGRIASVEVKNPEILPEEIEKKFIVLDVRAVDDVGREHDIEMQVRKYENYPKRTLYYLCKMYGDQLKAGQDYLDLHPVVGIHFLDYSPFPDSGADDFHYRFALRDVRHPDVEFNDDLSLHIFDLPAIERIADGKRNDNLMEWLRFFNHAHEEREESMQENYQNPMIRRAYDGLKALSADEKTRELAERREKALKDEVSFLNEARRTGRREERKDTALRLLKMNLLSLDQIAEATELDVREVERLKRSGGFGSA